jgi:prepilin-type N-terminal cleavage/methylation domain-containing protein
MRRVRGQAGFTLIEMLVSMILGLIVLTALMSLVDTSQHVTTTVTERADATQRGRLAMERMVQGLRSQVCYVLAGGALSNTQITVTNATDTSVTFFTKTNSPGDSLPAPSATPIPYVPVLRTLSLSNGTITQTDNAGALDTGGVTFTKSTASKDIVTTTLLTNVLQKTGVPVFTYYYYNADGNVISTTDGTTANPATKLVTPVSNTDLARIAMVEINYSVLPFDNTANADTQAGFKDAVTVRLPFPPPKSTSENRTVQCSI